MSKTFRFLFNHERYESIAVIIACGLLVYFYGCESKVQSLLFPDKQITRAELQIELETLLAQSENKFTKLDQQDQLKSLIFQQALQAATTGTINPVAALTTIGAVLGLGATIDNVRKRKEIKGLKNNSGTN